MSIKSQELPRGIKEKLLNEQPNIGRKEEHIKAFGNAGKDEKNQFPFPKYIIGADEINSGTSLKDFTPVSWQVITESDGEDFEFEYMGTGNDQFEFHSVSEGGVTGNLRKELKRIGLKDEFKNNDYTFSVIEIPSLYVLAYWLQPETTGASEVIVPMDPIPSFLSSKRTYDEKEFFSLLSNELKSQSTMGGMLMGEDITSPPPLGTSSEQEESIRKPDNLDDLKAKDPD